jgi:membrane protein
MVKLAGYTGPRARQWGSILEAVAKDFMADQIPMIAAGVTFYTLLAIFPGIAAAVSLYGLVADVKAAEQNIDVLSRIMPGGAIEVIGDQMKMLAGGHTGGLSLAFAISLATSIWSANGAMSAVITGLNVAYEIKERRGFVRRTLTSLAFTVGFLVFGIALIAIVAAGPAVQALLGGPAALVFDLVSWSVLFLILLVGLAILYRYGPSRQKVRWRWITWGSGAAVLLWLAMSAGFSLYVGNFGHYNKTYGSLGAVIGFMVWLYLSAMVILAGGELNAELEKHDSGGSIGRN